MYYQKLRREKVSLCNICREEKTLSWDHVPPKGGIEVSRVEVDTILDRLGGNEGGKPTYSQNGLKYRTICQDCNNYLGNEFDDEINSFARNVGSFLKSSLVIPQKSLFKIRPQRLMKALMGHLCAAKVDIENTTFDRLSREYVLDKNATLPDEVHIFYWVFPYNNFVNMRDFVMFTPRGLYKDPAMFQTLKYFPIAYMCTEASEYDGLPSLSKFRHYGLDAEVAIPVDFTLTKPRDWPEAPTDDGNVIFGGQSAMRSLHATPK